MYKYKIGATLFVSDNGETLEEFADNLGFGGTYGARKIYNKKVRIVGYDKCDEYDYKVVPLDELEEDWSAYVYKEYLKPITNKKSRIIKR